MTSNDKIRDFDRGWDQGHADAMRWAYGVYVATENFRRGYEAGHKSGECDRLRVLHNRK